MYSRREEKTSFRPTYTQFKTEFEEFRSNIELNKTECTCALRDDRNNNVESVEIYQSSLKGRKINILKHA